jgi:hypothetical protein
MKVLDHLLKAVRNTAEFNPEVLVAPACILWPDRDRQWEEIMPLLRVELPELLTLGDYAPDDKTGPAVWLRCVIAGAVAEISCADRIPILYLPGVSRQDLRAVEDCADLLKPLAELQYRGVIWSQSNGKDWTILSYLKSDQGGLALDVAQGSGAKKSMQLALHRLLNEDIKLLKGKRLDRDYFNTLLTGDPIRDLLEWLDKGDSFKAVRPENEWKAFAEVCKSKLGFYPETEGVLAGAMQLAEHKGPWQNVWERYREAPGRYPDLPDQIRKCKAPVNSIFWVSGDESFDGWPQWNDDQEKRLRQDLLALVKIPAHEVGEKLLAMEKQHGSRREMVWAELGEAPLASAVKHLAVVAEVTSKNLAAGTVDDLKAGYTTQGWRADDEVNRALACVEKMDDFKAVQVAIRAVYLPWLEDSARYLQKIVDGSLYPGGSYLSAESCSFAPGDCILFVDGLRFDTAKRLVKLLQRKNFNIAEQTHWAPLPAVTATGKAAITPVRDKLEGLYGNVDFEPAVADTKKPFTGYYLKKLLKEAGWTVLERLETGNGQGNGWCEFGDLDHEGHVRGWKLVKHIDTLLLEVRDRIDLLLQAGWKKVHVVTDHGWLLLPGGLPKIELSSALTDSKWGRCAALKPGAETEERVYPWYWNPDQHFALADGVSCFKKGEEYTHGGLSLQECLLLRLTVVQGASDSAPAGVEITDIVWKGLRCTVAVDGEFTGLSLDIRRHSGDPKSRVALSVKKLKANGSASVVIEDEDLEGKSATVVILDENDTLIAQVPTVIGGGES